MTTLSVHKRIEEVPADDWDRLAPPDNPFLEHAFLRLLEETGCVGPRTGWQPRHLVLRSPAGIVGVAPSYARADSRGEYIFDWGWAEAAARLGLDYYPKVTCAVPFTPATGGRLLGAPRELASALRALCDDGGASSAHVLFCRDDEAAVLHSEGWLRRASLQLHWRNDGYEAFEAFLSRLTHEDRKHIRRERRRVVEAGYDVDVWTGPEVPPALWPRIYDLYASIYERKWGRPYLTRRFFERIPEVLGERAVVVVARKHGDVRAMTLSFERGRHLYGRYWGSFDEVPGLHFELCYYRLIERAIARRLVLVEAGAQGEHKLKRGFLPCVTHSAHYIADERLRAAVARFLRDEHGAVLREQQQLLAHGPFKEGAAPPYPLVAGVDLR